MVRETLTREGCLDLLAAAGGHGRVAATMRAVPVILTVRFSVVDEQIVFDPGSAEPAARAVAESVVAFEADEVDPAGVPQWAVHVTGVAHTVTGTGPSRAFRLSSDWISGWRSAAKQP